MPPAEPRCPVCTAPTESRPSCATCGWRLTGPYRPGAVTPELAERFAGRLATARRRIDLAAAARAARHGGTVDAALFGRLLTLLRDGPASPEEQRSAMAVADDGRADPPWPDPAAVVVEADADGIVVPRFTAADGGDLVEDAEPVTRSWSELVRRLPADDDERRFRLAGGIGTGPHAYAAEPDPAAVRAVADRLPDVGVPVVLADRTGGWPVSRATLDALAAHRPGTRPWSAARPGPRRSAMLRVPVGISAFAGSRDGDPVLAAGTPDGSVWLWSGGPVRTVGTGGGRITALAAGFGQLVTGHRDGSVRVRALRGDDGGADVLIRHTGWVNAVGVVGGAVFSLGDDGAVRRTPLEPGEPGYRVDVGFSTATALATDRDARLLAVAGSDQTIRFFDGRTGEPRPPVRIDMHVTRLALTSTGDRLAAGGTDGSVLVYDLADPAFPRLVTRLPGAVSGLLIDHIGVVAGDTGGLLVRQESMADPVVVGRYGGPVRGLARTADGRIAGAGADGLVRVWGSAAPAAATRHHREDR